jgi:ABC-type Zn2+ transport system substrate-binding protein/surface adhesin
MLGRLVVASFLFAASNVAAEVPDVTVSIAPLASLVASVLGDLGHPHTLVPPGATEHVYALRPSDADALAGADLVVWIGPEFERFLAKPLAGLPSTTRILTLGSDPRLAHLPLRGGDSWPAHDHDGLEDRNDDHTELDGHLWLDPANARAIVAARTATARTPETWTVGWSLSMPNWPNPSDPCRTGHSWCSMTPTSISSAATGFAPWARSWSIRIGRRVLGTWRSFAN